MLNLDKINKLIDKYVTEEQKAKIKEAIKKEIVKQVKLQLEKRK